MLRLFRMVAVGVLVKEAKLHLPTIVMDISKNLAIDVGFFIASMQPLVFEMSEIAKIATIEFGTVVDLHDLIWLPDARQPNVHSHVIPISIVAVGHTKP